MGGASLYDSRSDELQNMTIFGPLNLNYVFRLEFLFCFSTLCNQMGFIHDLSITRKSVTYLVIL